MERNPHSAASQPASGSQTCMRARLTGLIHWLGPAWAALCGGLASGNFGWQGQDWLRLAVLIVLVDVGWGVLWAALGSTDWAVPLARWRDWRSGEPAAALPYTLPGSPGGRASQWVGQLRAWWRDVFWAECGIPFSAILVTLLATLVLAVLLGTEALLLSAAALAIMQLGLAWEGGRGIVPPKLDALIGVALPWMAGHLLFSGSLSLFSGGLALAYAIAWGAAWGVQAGRERLLGFGCQLAVALLLVVLRSPLAAGWSLLLMAPQLALLPWLGRGQPVSWYVRYSRPWLMAAMLTAAWAL